MSNEGANVRGNQPYGGNFGSRAQDLRVDQGRLVTGIPTSNRSLGSTTGFGFGDVFSDTNHPAASSVRRLRPIFEIGDEDPVVTDNDPHHQQGGPSAAAVPHIYPPFDGELGRGFLAPNPEQHGLFSISQNALDPELIYQFRNMEMGQTYGGSYPVAQGTVTNLGSGNYRQSTASVLQQQNPLGAAIGAPAAPYSPTTQWTYNSDLSTGTGSTAEMIQPGEFRSFYPGGRSLDNEIISSNIQQQGLMGNIPNPNEMGNSASRNVGVTVAFPSNTQESTELNLLDPTALQGIENFPDLQQILATRNSIYDPIYEQLGIPVDPHLRLFLAEQRRQRNARQE